MGVHHRGRVFSLQGGEVQRDRVCCLAPPSQHRTEPDEHRMGSLAGGCPPPQPPCLSSLWLGPSLIKNLLGLPIYCQGHLLQALRNLWTAQLVSGQRVDSVWCSVSHL